MNLLAWAGQVALRLPAHAWWENQFCSSSIVLLRGYVIKVLNFFFNYLLSYPFYAMQWSSGLFQYYHPHAIYWHIETGDEIEQNHFQTNL